MTESMLEWGQRHALSFDYDMRRWVRVPEPGSVDNDFIEMWSRETAKAWANDLGLAQNAQWVELLVAIFETTARQTYTNDPDAVFLHLLTPQLQAPSPLVATLMTYPADEPLDDFAAKLADAYLAEAVRPPSLEPAPLSTAAPAWLVTATVPDDDATLQVRQHLLWQIHEYMHVGLTMAGDDIARVLQATEDLLGLAAAVELVERPG